MAETTTSQPAGRVGVGGEVAYISIPQFGRSRAQFQTPTAIFTDGRVAHPDCCTSGGLPTIGVVV